MSRSAPLVLLGAVLFGFLGCSKEPPIITYSVPTTVPAVLAPEDTRMVAAIIPQKSQAWFFKVMGKKSAVDLVSGEFRQFVQAVEFEDGQPVIEKLPEGWRKGRDRAMRFASVDVETPIQQLDLSISQLARMDEWDQLVQSNVNRWRGQVGLDPLDEKWGGAEELDREAKTESETSESEEIASEAPAIWVDLVGSPSDSGPPPMAGRPPFASMASADPSADPHAGLPKSAQEAVAQAKAKAAPEKSGTDPGSSKPKTTNSSKPKLEFDRPEGWRDGRMSMMRMAAFNVGKEEQQAEVTVMTAGGDLRANVARWMGQIAASPPSEDQVDKALADAEKVEVSGRDAQRFILLPGDESTGEESEKPATAIDATIVPLDGGFSLFVKMTGPVATVKAEDESMRTFLQSLRY